MKPFPKWLVLLSSLATGVTGIAYFALDRLYVPTDPFAIGHPLESWLLEAHILVAPVLVFAIGLIAFDHIWKHFRCLVPAGRRSGILATIAFLPMVLSGYLIQTTSSVAWVEALGWLHLGVGVGYLLGVITHRRAFKRGSAVTRRRAAGATTAKLIGGRVTISDQEQAKPAS